MVRPCGEPGHPKNRMKPLACRFGGSNGVPVCSLPDTGATELVADELAFSFYVRGGGIRQGTATIFDRLRSCRNLDLPSTGRPPLSGACRRQKRQRPAGAGGAELAATGQSPTLSLRRETALPCKCEASAPIRPTAPALDLDAFPNCLLPADMPDDRAAQAQLRKTRQPRNPRPPRPADRPAPFPPPNAKARPHTAFPCGAAGRRTAATLQAMAVDLLRCLGQQDQRSLARLSAE